MPKYHTDKVSHAGNVSAVAFLLEVPVTQVKGYVVIGVDGEGQLAMATNRCCMLHAADALADAIKCLVTTETCSSDAVT